MPLLFQKNQDVNKKPTVNYYLTQAQIYDLKSFLTLFPNWNSLPPF
jgi:hypothetical protein